MKNNVLETVLGAVVLVIAGFFIYLAYTSGQTSIANGYHVIAQFDRIDGLSQGNDVRISGVKVGNVLKMDIDPESYQAKVTLNIRQDVKLSKDTSAEIVSESLLGGKYISLSPGADEEVLKNNDVIIHTQSSVNFEQLIGKFMFSKNDEEKTKPAAKKH